jgi:hypothetical protein
MVECGDVENLQRTSTSATTTDSGIATAEAKKGERKIVRTAAEGVFILADVFGSLGDRRSVSSFASELMSCEVMKT